ncbi:AbfB domain-containing protein [Streptomyces sp. GESEQ-35]|uniref:AbfB domain-containing protein n=1 Tax=Streptomyces sp. GESEQ-35 TaxID=2812657 RepID=UPI001B31D5B2|nr:AbfB domain-containing protein [Streptomyces sp. GESEQ-35]
MPQTPPRPPRNQPWEHGWTPDTSRIPGTRRLWLAGTLAVATIAACVTAIAVTDKGVDEASGAPESPVNATLPGLISFGSPSPSTTTPPKGRSGSPSAEPTKTPPSRHGSTPTPSAKPSKSTAPEESSPTPATNWRSVRAVNYSDRYWHAADDSVALDRITSAGAAEDATFRVVNGLARSSCYSFATADGSYLRHRNFVLREEHDDGSSLFEQDATFCARPSSFSGAVMLESVNYPGRFLRHRNFVVRLESYEHSDSYRQDSAFRLVAGLGD